MPEELQAPRLTIATVTYTDGRVEKYETGTPRMVYDANRLGVRGDDIEMGFFMLWFAAGKPGVNGGPVTIDTARPALEAWLDTVRSVDTVEVDQSGPPTKRRATSRGSAA